MYRKSAFPILRSGGAKRLILPVFALCTLWSLGAQGKLPEPVGFVNDFAGILERADMETLENLTAAVKEKTGAELAVVTVDSYAPYPSLDDFSLALAAAWGIGKQGEDNGVLFILAMGERKVKIETGYGLEGAIPDSMAGRILDRAVIPDFRQNNFSGGLVKGAQAIAAAIAREKGIDPADLNAAVPEDVYSREDGENSFLYFLPFFLWLLPFFLTVLGVKKRRRTRFGGFSFRGFGSSGFSGGSSGGFGGFGGGGFGGFGGGGFGGGGASRGF